MLPVKLSIQGINSYQKHYTINFSQLIKGGLFGIFGSVGGGKSTIIDAITLALYDEAEKLGKREKRNYNIMNLQSNELYIDFEFLAGENYNDKYRFVVEGKRSKKFEEVKAFSRKMYYWKNNKWQPNEHLVIEDILGLSYENFKRTIIIPQGKFQEFMQLGDTERTRMLSDIFSLNKYEFYNQTAELEKQKTEEQNLLKGELGSIENISKEKITGLENQLNIEILEGEKLQQEADTLNTQNENLKTLKVQFNELEVLNEAFENLKTKEASFKKREENLEAFKLCNTQFKPIFERIYFLQKKQHDLNTKLNNIDEQLKNTNQQEIFQKETVKKIENEVGNEQNIKQKIEDWKTALDLQNNNNEIVKVKDEFEQEKESINRLSEKLKKATAFITDKNQEINKLKQKVKPLNKLQQIENWWNKQQLLQNNKSEIEDDLNKLTLNIHKLSDRKNEILKPITDIQLKSKLEKEKTNVCQNILFVKINEHEKLITEIDDKINHLNFEEKLAQFSENLVNNQPCPLCGSLHHPTPLSIENNQQALQNLNQQKSLLIATNKVLQNCRLELAQLVTEYKNIVQQKTDLQNKQNDISIKIDEHQQNFTWNEYQQFSLQQISSQLQELQKVNEQITGLESTLTKANSKENELKQRFEKQQESLNKNQVKLAELTASFNIKQQQLKTIDYQLIHEQNTTQINQKIEILTQNVHELVSSKNAIDLLKNKRLELNADFQNLTERIKETTHELDNENQQLNHLTELSEFDNTGEILNILEWEIDIETEQQGIKEFNERFSKTSNKIEQLTESIGNKKYKSNEHIEIQTNLEKTSQKLSEQQKQIGKLEAEINQAKKDYERKAHLNSEIEKLDAQISDIKTLKSMFYRSGFVNFVSKIYIDNLCAEANKRFTRLTKNQLSLEVNENNQFEVRDHLNGGNTRAVKTLSGGQTFKAALCLALALSEQVNNRQYQGKQFFFIDEGFGALDKDSLQVVYETLQGLAKENKVIGVISHMESLQENISTYLQISNGENGSHITTSWES